MQTRLRQLILFKLYSVIEYFLLMNFVGILIISLLKLPAEKFDWLLYLQLSTILQSFLASMGLVLSLTNAIILLFITQHKKKIFRFSLLLVSIVLYALYLFYSLLESALALGS